jgi:hypothetical protein
VFAMHMMSISLIIFSVDWRLVDDGNVVMLLLLLGGCTTNPEVMDGRKARAKSWETYMMEIN